MAIIRCLHKTGELTESCTRLLHTICGIPLDLLETARVKPNKRNWLRFPWFNENKGGGAAVLGRNIYFTANFFAHSELPVCYGNGELLATKQWLLLLAHEVGHLPQAHIVGYNPLNRAAYVLWFGLNYAWFGLTSRRPYTECMPLEISADRGRKVLIELLYNYGQSYEDHPLIRAVHSNDLARLNEWLAANEEEVNAAKLLHGL